MNGIELQPENKSGRVWPLYGAAFMMSLSVNSWWTSMPFIIDNIGGTKAHVGYAWAANYLCYIVCLILTGLFLGSHNPKNTTRIASAVILAATAASGVIIYHIISRDMKGSLLLIWLIIAAGAVTGGVTSLYWPYLMSWVSEDLKGEALNRRLGNYNGSWSSSLIIGPLLGGALVQRSSVLPAIFVSAGLVLCFMFLNFSKDSVFHATLISEDEEQKNNSNGLNKKNIMRLRWMARIALFSSWACIAVARSQFALLFTSMGNSETMFGVLIMIFGFINFSTLTLAGRYAFWHFKPYLLLAAQATLAIAIVLIIVGRTLPVFILLFVIMGCGFGFAYGSHLYYGTCGAKKRSVQMMIHEGTISLGVTVGSAAGGYLASNFGTYQPYWFALILVGAGFLAQLLLIPRYAENGFTR